MSFSSFKVAPKQTNLNHFIPEFDADDVENSGSVPSSQNVETLLVSARAVHERFRMLPCLENNALMCAIWRLLGRMQALGNDAAEAEQFSTALRHWDAALAQGPTPQQAGLLQEQKAQVLMELNRMWDAIQCATAATEVAPEWLFGYLTLGRAQLLFGEPELAVRTFEKVEAMDGDGYARQAALKDLCAARAAVAAGMTSQTVGLTQQKTCHVGQVKAQPQNTGSNTISI